MTKQVTVEQEVKKPWLYRAGKALWAFVCAGVILAFAILGAYAKIKSGNNEVRLGLAVLIVGALAAPLIERLFDRFV